MSYLVVCLVSFLAALLTFFSGFGLGTLLLPAFALFFPVERAVALTAVVHFLNGLFKVWLVGRHADRWVVVRFGLPAIFAAMIGAGVLLWLSGVGPVYSYRLGNQTMQVTPVKLVIGLLLLSFVVAESLPPFRDLSFDSRYLPLGGLLSGFFGGLSGNQGALRSMFLSKLKLTKEAFVGTGAMIACLVDVSRLGVYFRSLLVEGAQLDYGLLIAAVSSAFVGSALGNRFLKKITMQGVQQIVVVAILVVALGLVSGLL